MPPYTPDGIQRVVDELNQCGTKLFHVHIVWDQSGGECEEDFFVHAETCSDAIGIAWGDDDPTAITSVLAEELCAIESIKRDET